MAARLQAVWLGGTAYGPALALQRRLVDARHTDHSNSSSSDSKGASPSVGLGRVWDTDVVLGVVHPPTYTVGRRLVGDVAEAARLRALGADYYEVRVPVPVPVLVCLCACTCVPVPVCLCLCESELRCWGASGRRSVAVWSLSMGLASWSCTPSSACAATTYVPVCLHARSCLYVHASLCLCLRLCMCMCMCMCITVPVPLCLRARAGLRGVVSLACECMWRRCKAHCRLRAPSMA
jgi:hypothetical protein